MRFVMSLLCLSVNYGRERETEWYRSVKIYVPTTSMLEWAGTITYREGESLAEMNGNDELLLSLNVFHEVPLKNTLFQLKNNHKGTQMPAHVTNKGSHWSG